MFSASEEDFAIQKMIEHNVTFPLHKTPNIQAAEEEDAEMKEAMEDCPAPRSLAMRGRLLTSEGFGLEVLEIFMWDMWLETCSLGFRAIVVFRTLG